MKDLPIYDITIEDDAEIQGVSKISLVDVPAIGVNWIALRKMPTMMMAVRKKKPKMAFIKKECLGCPPNGDGTRVNGEPDKRCKDTKGEGGGKTPKGGAKGGGAKVTKTETKSGADIAAMSVGKSSAQEKGNGTTARPKIEISEENVNTALKNISQIPRYVNPPSGKMYEILPTRGRSSDSITVWRTGGGFGRYEVGQIDGVNSKGEIVGQPTWKTLNSDNSVERDVKEIFDENLKFVKSKQTFAKKECFACPPNGDGTRVNGEPDKRCKGDGAEKTPKGGAKSAGKKTVDEKTEATTNSRSFIEDKVAKAKTDAEFTQNATYTTESGKKVFIGSFPDNTYTEPIKVSAADIAHINDKIANEVGAFGKPMYKTKTLSDGSTAVFMNRGRTSIPSLEGTVPGIYAWHPTMIISGESIRTPKPVTLGSGRIISPSEWTSTNPQMKNLNDLLKLKKQTFAKKECLACPPNGDGTRVNGEPDRRCKDTKGDGSGGRTKAAGWSTPKQTYDPSKKTSGASDKGPAIGENYDMKNFQSGVAAPNGKSMSDIYGPEYQNEALLKNNIESGATVISTKNGIQAKSYETGSVFTQADVRDRSLQGQYGARAKDSTPFTPLQVDQYSKLAYYGDSKIGAPLLDKEIKHIESQNGKGFTIRKVGDKTEIIEKRTRYKSTSSGGQEKIGEGERKIGHIKDGKLYVSGWNGPDWMNSGYGSDYKTRTNPREQRERDLKKLFGY